MAAATRNSLIGRWATSSGSLSSRRGSLGAVRFKARLVSVELRLGPGIWQLLHRMCSRLGRDMNETIDEMLTFMASARTMLDFEDAVKKLPSDMSPLSPLAGRAPAQNWSDADSVKTVSFTARVSMSNLQLLEDAQKALATANLSETFVSIARVARQWGFPSSLGTWQDEVAEAKNAEVSGKALPLLGRTMQEQFLLSELDWRRVQLLATKAGITGAASSSSQQANASADVGDTVRELVAAAQEKMDVSFLRHVSSRKRMDKATEDSRGAVHVSFGLNVQLVSWLHHLVEEPNGIDSISEALSLILDWNEWQRDVEESIYLGRYDRRELYTHDRKPAVCTTVILHERSDRLFCSNNSQVDVWHVVPGCSGLRKVERLFRFDGSGHSKRESEIVSAMEYDFPSRLVFAAYRSGAIFVWSEHTGHSVVVLRGHQMAVDALCVARRSSETKDAVLISSGNDHQIRAWSITQNATDGYSEVNPLWCISRPWTVTRLLFDAQTSSLFIGTGLGDASVRVYPESSVFDELNEQELTAVLSYDATTQKEAPQEFFGVFDMAVAKRRGSSGHLHCYCSYLGFSRVVLWDVSTRQQVRQISLVNCPDSVLTVRLLESQRVLAIGRDGYGMSLHNLSTGLPLCPLLPSHAREMQAAAGDSHRLALAGLGQVILLDFDSVSAGTGAGTDGAEKYRGSERSEVYVPSPEFEVELDGIEVDDTYFDVVDEDEPVERHRAKTEASAPQTVKLERRHRRGKSSKKDGADQISKQAESSLGRPPSGERSRRLSRVEDPPSLRALSFLVFEGIQALEAISAIDQRQKSILKGRLVARDRAIFGAAVGFHESRSVRDFHARLLKLAAEQQS